MHVVATAGHVDHGKSTLVRALTGMEPDRWAEERRRGMTIDLGFAWTELGDACLALVDVPGHHRFLSSMLAGVGPVPAVLFVVAADAGWSRQSEEHLSAIDALGVTRGLLAVTRSDLADPGPASAEAQARLARSTLSDVEVVAVSGVTGQGLDELRAALRRLVDRLPPPDLAAPVRLWIDRRFTISGAGTVVTGTLPAGRIRVGDELQLVQADGVRPVRVRGLQSLGTSTDQADAVARVAVNLRGIEAEALARGDALLTPGTAWRTAIVDAELTADPAELPRELVLHIGSAAVPVQVRPLGEAAARLRLATPLPLRRGDRAVLRNPGGQRVVAGAAVLDLDPPPLMRRGAAAERAAALAQMPGPVEEVRRRGPLSRDQLALLGILDTSADLPAGLQQHAGYVVDDGSWRRWTRELGDAVAAEVRRDPLSAGLPLESARQRLDLPSIDLVTELASAAGLTVNAGRLRAAEAGPALPPAVRHALDALIQRLQKAPFEAPEAGDLTSAGLTPAMLAAASSDGLITRLPGEIVLLPDAVDEAVRRLAQLPQPFTTSQARQALGTTRRVAIPLLEHLDRLRRTRRADDARRVVLR